MEEGQKNEIIPSNVSYKLSVWVITDSEKKTELLSRMINSIWLVVNYLENIVIQKISCYIEWWLKHLSVFGLRAIMTT